MVFTNYGDTPGVLPTKKKQNYSKFASEAFHQKKYFLAKWINSWTIYFFKSGQNYKKDAKCAFSWESSVEKNLFYYHFWSS